MGGVAVAWAFGGSATGSINRGLISSGTSSSTEIIIKKNDSTIAL